MANNEKLPEPPSEDRVRQLHPGDRAQPIPMFTAKAPDDKKAIAQTLLEARRMCRSLEATMEATYPLTEHPDVLKKVETMQAHLAEISKELLAIYTPWAREAFKE